MDYDLSLPGSNSFTDTFASIIPNVSSNILWIILGLMTVVLGFTTLVLYYHWLRYAFGNKMVIFAGVLYTLVTVAGLMVMASAAGYYA
jgi:uncharacterized membrane protein